MDKNTKTIDAIRESYTLVTKSTVLFDNLSHIISLEKINMLIKIARLNL